VAVLAVAGALGMAATAFGAPAGVADDRFDAITGPFGAFVVKPDGFGVDAGATPLDVPALLDQVDGANLAATVSALAFHRTADDSDAVRQQATDLVVDGLTSAGYAPQTQSVVLGRTGKDEPNVFAELPGTECPSRTLVIGAHYDSEHPTGPGADDNASGVAGMLEIARILHDHPLPITVRFVGWSYEEEGLVGAFAMARQLKGEGREVAGAISLEMIGFTEPDIDPLTGLPGTYLAMVADPTSAPLARAFAAAAYTYTPEFPAFGAVIDPNVLPDILRSDHAAFLANGFPALMATDTANFRNPNYHTATDTVASLDPAFHLGSTRAALAGLVTFGSVDGDGDGHADACVAPVAATTTSTAPPPSAPPAGPTGAEAVDGAADLTG
jgi:hypothetical protein